MNDRDEADATTTDPQSTTKGTSAASDSIRASRRAFIGALGGTGAASALSGGAAVLVSKTAKAQDISPVTGAARAKQAFLVRTRAATQELAVPIPAHPDNDDEERYPNRIGSFTKGLPHNASGEVVGSAYDALLTGLRAGTVAALDQVPLGGTRKLVNPLSGLAFTLEGVDSHQTFQPPAPALASQEEAGEAVELYWQALLRDVPFTEYATDPLAQRAADELSRLPVFRGPKQGGRVTPQTLFRDALPGALVGPYLSQFFYRSAPFGREFVERTIATALPGDDHVTDYAEWLAIQNGQPPAAPTRSIRCAGSCATVETSLSSCTSISCSKSSSTRASSCSAWWAKTRTSAPAAFRSIPPIRT